MDRVIIQPGQVPLAEDFLRQNRNTLVGLGAVNHLLGNGTQNFWDGFEVSVVPGTLSVLLQPGSVMSSEYQFDSTAYGSLPATAETVPLLARKGDVTSLTFAPTGSAGQSQNFLVQAALSQTDTNPVVRPYYNAANPAQAYAGPDGQGDATNTLRKVGVNVSVKSGTPAATGSQATPSADPNYLPLYVVTIAGGATTLSAGNIAKVASHALVYRYKDLSQGFAASTGTNGYQKLPSGVIIQWGTGGTTAGHVASTGDAIAFPIPFTTAVRSITVTESNSTSGGWVAGGSGPTVYGWAAGANPLTGFKVSCLKWNGTTFVNSASTGYAWTAIGI